MRPFTRAQLREAGYDQSILRTTDFKQVMRGVWIHRDGVDDDTLIGAALAIHPEAAWASHLSAAKVLRLPVPDHPFAHVTVGKHEDRLFRAKIKPHVTKRPRRVIVAARDPDDRPGRDVHRLCRLALAGRVGGAGRRAREAVRRQLPAGAPRGVSSER